MDKVKCGFVVGLETSVEGEEKGLKYKMCGLPAQYVVGSWCICEKHKKYYCDPRNWKAVKLEESDEEVSGGC